MTTTILVDLLAWYSLHCSWIKLRIITLGLAIAEPSSWVLYNVIMMLIPPTKDEKRSLRYTVKIVNADVDHLAQLMKLRASVSSIPSLSLLNHISPQSLKYSLLTAITRKHGSLAQCSLISHILAPSGYKLHTVGKYIYLFPSILDRKTCHCDDLVFFMCPLEDLRKD